MRNPRKVAPARAHVLDAPERERYLPTDALLALLALEGDETVLDYGAGTGGRSAAVAEALSDGGAVIAVDESAEMVERLATGLAGVPHARPLRIAGNHVPLPDGCADRVLAVNLLHEIRGESALAEINRLLAADGFALIVDWERGRERDCGPPDHLLYTAADAAAALGAAGFAPERIDACLRLHFVIKAHPPVKES